MVVVAVGWWCLGGEGFFFFFPLLVFEWWERRGLWEAVAGVAGIRWWRLLLAWLWEASWWWGGRLVVEDNWSVKKFFYLFFPLFIF